MTPIDTNFTPDSWCPTDHGRLPAPPRGWRSAGQGSAAAARTALVGAEGGRIALALGLAAVAAIAAVMVRSVVAADLLPAPSLRTLAASDERRPPIAQHDAARGQSAVAGAHGQTPPGGQAPPSGVAGRR